MFSLSFRLLLIFSLVWIAALPVKAEILSLDMAQLGTQAGSLEISPDANFKSLLVTIKLGQSQRYLVNFPVTAPYYLRVQQRQKIVWQEAVFVLLESPDQTRHLELSWSSSHPGYRFSLWLSEPTGEKRLLETSDVRAYLGRLATPSLIRWRVQSDDGRDRPLQTIAWRWVAPSQKIQSQAQPQNMSKLPTIDLQAPEQDQSLYEPEYAGLLAGEENSHKFWSSKEEKLSLAPLHRQHRVLAWFRYLRESFNIDKQDRFAASPSQGLGTGLAAQYYILSQLSVSGSLETHATKTEYETGGTSEPAEVQKRVRSHLALGLDLLNTNSREPNWAFNLGPVGSFLQLPLVSDNQRVLDYGIKSSLQVFQPALNLDLLILKSGSRETSLVAILPWTVFSLRPFLGFYKFDTRQSSGAFTGLYLETGLRLGIERDF